MDKNGTFRKRKVSFSQVSNAALRDKKLSLRAKGLYGIISSYITMDDFTLYKSYLLSLSTDGKDSFNRVWDELKANGYLVQYQTKGAGGRYIYEYELLDQAKTLTEEEVILVKKKEDNRINRNARKTSNRNAKMSPQTEIPPMDENTDSTDGDSTPGASMFGESVPIVKTDLNNIDLNKTEKTTTTVSSGSGSIVDPPTVNELEIYSAFKNSLGKAPNSSVKLQIKGILRHQDSELIIHAIQKTAGNNKEWNYAKSMLNNWKNDGILTIHEQIKRENQD